MPIDILVAILASMRESQQGSKGNHDQIEGQLFIHPNYALGRSSLKREVTGTLDTPQTATSRSKAVVWERSLIVVVVQLPQHDTYYVLCTVVSVVLETGVLRTSYIRSK
jgi:hypothetical protein